VKFAPIRPTPAPNPVNRLLFLNSRTSNGTLARMGPLVPRAPIPEDLSDYRPGLQARAEHGVLHLSSSQNSKADVRALARELGLREPGGTADGPACLGQPDRDRPAG